MSNPGTGNGAKNVVLAIVAVIVIGWWQLAKYLNRKVYEGWIEGSIHAIFSFVAALAVAGYTGNIVEHGGNLGFHLPYVSQYLSQPHPGGAFWAGVKGFAFMELYGYALIWLGVVKWFFKAARSWCKNVSNYLEQEVGPVGIRVSRGERIAYSINRVATFLPGSSALWAQLRQDSRDHKESAFVVLQYVVTVLGLCYLTWLAGDWAYAGVIAFATASVLGSVLTAFGALVALFVAVVVGYPAFCYLGMAATYALGELAAFVTGYYAWHWLGLGMDHISVLHAVPLVVAHLTLAYAYPGITLLLSNEFIKRAYKRVKPMVDQAYDDKDVGFRQIFQQVLNIVATVAIVVTAYIFWHALTLPLWLGAIGYASLPLVAFATYGVLGKVLDWDGGNIFVGASAGLSVFSYTMVKVGYDSWMQVLTQSIPASVLTSAFAVVIVVPAIYCSLRWVATRALIAEATKSGGATLHDLHARAWAQLKDWSAKCERVYWSVYGDKAGQAFQKLAAYVASFLVALVVAGAVGFYTSKAGLYVSIPTGLLAFSFAFLIGKRAVFDELAAVGAVTSLALAIVLAIVLKDATVYGMAFAAPFAAVAAVVTHFGLFPLVYLGAKRVCDPFITNGLLPLFEALYNRLTSLFGKIIDKVVAFFKFLYPYWKKLVNFLAPYLAFVGRFFAAGWVLVAAGWNAVAQAWNSVFGKKS